MDKFSSKALKFYLRFNQVALGIIVLSTFVGSNWGTMPSTNYLVTTLVFVLNLMAFLAFPIVTLVSWIAPTMGTMQAGPIGIATLVLYAIFAIILFEMLHRITIRIDKHQFYTTTTLSLYEIIVRIISIMTVGNFIGNVLTSVMEKTIEVLDTFTQAMRILEMVPWGAVLLLVILVSGRKMFKQNIELKKEQQLTV